MEMAGYNAKHHIPIRIIQRVKIIAKLARYVKSYFHWEIRQRWCEEKSDSSVPRRQLLKEQVKTLYDEVQADS